MEQEDLRKLIAQLQAGAAKEGGEPIMRLDGLGIDEEFIGLLANPAGIHALAADLLRTLLDKPESSNDKIAADSRTVTVKQAGEFYLCHIECGPIPKPVSASEPRPASGWVMPPEEKARLKGIAYLAVAVAVVYVFLAGITAIVRGWSS